MAKALPPDKLFTNAFLLAMGVVVAWIAAAFTFVILD